LLRENATAAKPFELQQAAVLQPQQRSTIIGDQMQLITAPH